MPGHDVQLTLDVDAQRIAFYGLSYGGKTAVRVPPMLKDYCLSICSADFNEWVRKNATNADKYSYLFTPEYEMFEWNMGHVANYAELADLMAPRPFMVERGHDDGVAPDEWVAWEYAKVRRFYDKLGGKDVNNPGIGEIIYSASFFSVAYTHDYDQSSARKTLPA